MKTLNSFMVLAIPAAFFIGAACTETPEGDLKFEDEEVGQVSQAIDNCATHDNIRAYYNNFGIPSTDYNYDTHAEMDVGPVKGMMFHFVFDADDNLVSLDDWTITPAE